MAVDAVIVSWLTAWDAKLVGTGWGLFGSALLLVIAIACWLSIGLIIRNSPNAVLTTMVSQIFVACLAVYVWLVDVHSPVHQYWGITGVALSLGGIALFWVIFLSRHAEGAIKRGAVVIAALFPALGLVQFWIQHYYLPESSRPGVDLEAELSPAGYSGPIVHLKAKYTLHNYGSADVELPAGLVRVVEYPNGTTPEPPTPEFVAEYLGPLENQFRDYRETPAKPVDAKLIYAASIATSDMGSFLLAGQTVHGEAAVDIDTRAVRLVQLGIDVIAVTHQEVKDTRTCYPPHKSFNADPLGFVNEARNLHDLGGSDAAQVLCEETQFAPRGVIEELVSDHPLLRITTVVREDGLPTPLLAPQFGTAESLDPPSTTPSAHLTGGAEYAPAESDLLPKH
ncbi:hypothetical protein [Mycobacterium sp. OTB74]|uniref:hypothetical protein n=1 Tax=Mycobacterium sp. OTB74 TaxID=1853452 RepID=UPI0024769576|nr:hypothetical protein [Mycobacterium sp. OTB74]